MFEDQFGNKLALGDVVVYTRNSYSVQMQPTLAKITKICSELDWRGNTHSYISVQPVISRMKYGKDEKTWELESSRPLRRVKRVLKVDKSMLENLIGKPINKPM